MQLLDQAEPGNGASMPALARDALDAYKALGIEFETFVPGAFWEGYRAT